VISQIRPADLESWLQQHQGARPIVLDVREPWEIETAHVKVSGFELVSIPMAAMPARLAELQKDRPIACLCHLGGRSMQVAMFLEHHGFEDVTNLAGGIHAWSLERDPAVPMY